jgi:hypothetical protein
MDHCQSFEHIRNATEWNDSSFHRRLAGAEVGRFGRRTITVTANATIVRVFSLHPRHFEAHSNALTGTIPNEMTTLRLLTYLDLSRQANGGLSGTIPGGVGEMQSLRALFLDELSLHGTLPLSLASLSSLTYVV